VGRPEKVAPWAEIDRNLREQAEKLLRTHERIARLDAGDRLFVSTEVADYLDRLHELGVWESLLTACLPVLDTPPPPGP